MDIADVYKYFQSPPKPQYLNKEQTICYISKSLLENDLCATELIVLVQSSTRALSSTILSESLVILLESNIINSYIEKIKGKGRSRKMFTIIPEMKPQAEELANFWDNIA